MNYCANCVDICPTENQTVRALYIYDSDTEEYTQVSIVQALHKVFKPIINARFNDNQNAISVDMGQGQDHFFCLVCKDLFLELLDVYHKFTSVSKAGGYVYELIREHEVARNLNIDADDSNSLNDSIKIETGCPEVDRVEVDCSAFLGPDEDMCDNNMGVDVRDVNLGSTTANIDPSTKMQDPNTRNSPRRNKRKATAGGTDTVQMQSAKRRKKHNKIQPPEATDPKKEQSGLELISIEYKCIDCPGELFTSIPLWRQHQQTIHKRYFPRKRAHLNKDSKWIKRHGATVTLNYKPCPICGKGLSSNLKNHIEIAHPLSETKPEKCSICGFSPKHKLSLIGHMKRMHNSEREPEEYFCSICFQSFHTKSSLNVHEAVHRGEYKLKCRWECDVCHEKFQTKGVLDKHKTKHTDERPCVCQQCGKRFKNKQNLSSHIKRHETERRKDKLCDICGKGFEVPSRLKEHLIGVHKLSSEEAKQRAQVRQHVLRLNDEDANELADKLKSKFKPTLICGFCGKKYSRREYLWTHLIKGHSVTKEEALRVTGLETVRDLLGSQRQHRPDSSITKQNKITESSFSN